MTADRTCPVCGDVAGWCTYAEPVLHMVGCGDVDCAGCDWCALGD